MKFIRIDYEKKAKEILDSNHTDMEISDIELVDAILQEAIARGIKEMPRDNWHPNTTLVEEVWRIRLKYGWDCRKYPDEP